MKMSDTEGARPYAQSTHTQGQNSDRGCIDKRRLFDSRRAKKASKSMAYPAGGCLLIRLYQGSASHDSSMSRRAFCSSTVACNDAT